MGDDDTSRDALVERVARTWYDSQGFHAADSWEAETRLNRDANYLPNAQAVVDAVVMPLVEERDRLRAIAPEVRAAQHLAEVSALSIRDAMAAVGVVAERDAAIKRAEAAEAAHRALTDAVRAVSKGPHPYTGQHAAILVSQLLAILDEHGKKS